MRLWISSSASPTAWPIVGRRTTSLGPRSKRWRPKARVRGTDRGGFTSIAAPRRGRGCRPIPRSLRDRARHRSGGVGRFDSARRCADDRVAEGADRGRGIGTGYGIRFRGVPRAQARRAELMPDWTLSPAAQSDIDEIWDFSAERWGIAHADRYVRAIHSVVSPIAAGRGRIAHPIRRSRECA